MYSGSTFTFDLENRVEFSTILLMLIAFIGILFSPPDINYSCNRAGTFQRSFTVALKQPE